MADAKLTALTAASALAGADLFYVSQSAASRKATGTQLLTLVGTTYVPLAGNATMTGALTIASGTLTASAPALNITQTLNGAGVAFDGMSIAITSTASSAASTFAAFSIGGTRKHEFLTSGDTYLRGTCFVDGNLSANAAVFLAALTTLGWSNSSNPSGTRDLFLLRDAAATLAQRNGTTQQIFRLYNTYTDASNYERLAFTGAAGFDFSIIAETLGTGADNLNLKLTAAGSGEVQFRSYAVAYLGLGVGTGGGDGYMNSAGYRVRSTGRFSFAQTDNASDSADTALMRNAAGVVEVTNGTAGTWRDLKLRNLLAGGGNGSYVQTPSMTVANLAAAATAGAGARAFVTDANATTFLSTVAAGGANKVPVVSDGTNWLIG